MHGVSVSDDAVQEYGGGGSGGSRGGIQLRLKLCWRAGC